VDNADRIRRGLDRIWNHREWEEAARLFDEAVVIHEWTGPAPRRGLPVVRTIVEDLYAAFPDFNVTVDEVA
jgi:hypothetical protein